MTKFMDKSFSSRPSNEAYRIGWEKAFGKSSKGEDNDKASMLVSVKWCPRYYKNGRHCNWADIDVECGGDHNKCTLTETQLEIKAKTDTEEKSRLKCRDERVGE